METARALTKHVRISPRKARLIADQIRGLLVTKAREQLEFSPTKGGRLLLKTLNSAVANAEQDIEARPEELVVAEVRVDEGPTLKRAKSKCRGGRVPVMKRTSHFVVVVGRK